MRVAGALVTALLASACNGNVGPGEPAVEVGTGVDGFVALADGDTIDVVLGPQGGFHVYGSMRVTGIDPGNPADLTATNNPTTRFTVLRDGARLDIDASRYTQGLESAGEHFEMIGRLVILDIQTDDEVANAEVELTVEVTDVNGRAASDTRRLIAVPSPDNP